MKHYANFIGLLALMLGMIPFVTIAQKPTTTESSYHPYEVFDPTFFTTNGNEYRSASGVPGPKYWQNSASYLIHCNLNTTDSLLESTVQITYTNNSDDSLPFLWLQLDQNLFDPNSRGAATTLVSGDRFDVKGYTKGGDHIQNVSVIYKGRTYNIEPIITDTRMQLRLPFKVHPHGDKIDIKVQYNFSIPHYGADRMGRMNTEKGEIYQLAQWYPRMCVYDDIQGWNTLPYMGQGEFYCEYGNYDYYITVPSDMIVAGSGDLQNPEEVLTTQQIARLKKARQSDSTVTIISEQEVGTPQSRPKNSGKLTWHFKMENSRDVAWTASRSFIWDAARIQFPSGRKGISMAVYPAESEGEQGYSRATQYLKQSIEFYSKHYFEYPWNSAVAVAGVALGMEYPGIVFCSYKIKNGDLWGDITHEIGHNWFPMIVGSNERRFMWMDEGLNTFINGYATSWFNNGEYKDTSTRQRIGMLMYTTRGEDPLMTPPESMGFRDAGLYYFKTAAALNILRNEVIGEDRFDYAFKNYIKNWAFKHPQPDDFFRSMNNATGEDLNWFWKEWFYTTWKLDQAVTKVQYINEDASKGALITIENLGKMVLPVKIEITQKSGDPLIINLPVEIWQRGSSWTFQAGTRSEINSVIIDPDQKFPDINRDNNVWNAH